MKIRLLGTMIGATIGALIGAGTGIVGGPFGAVAGMSVFMIGGAIWGFSAGPDLTNQLRRWRDRKNNRH